MKTLLPLYQYTILISIFLFDVQSACLDNDGVFNHIFPPIIDDIKLFEGETKFFSINCSGTNMTNDNITSFNNFCPYYSVREIQIATVFFTSNNCSNTFSVKGIFLGRTRLYIFNSSKATLIDESIIKFPVTVIRNDRLIDKVFIVLVTLLVACSYVGMGCTVDLKVVKEVLVKPVAPIIGFLCQYVIMPLTAFGMVMLLGISGGIGLGLFASGCAPGGGASNMYTLLLNGDVSLSVTMTLISTAASLGMYPLWLFTLGRIVYSGSEDTHLRVPFQNIIITLATMIVPVSIGLLIRRFCPKVATIIVTHLLRPFCILIIIFLFTFGIYSNLYILRLISLPLIIAACAVPWIGFLGGALISLVTRQPRGRVIAIAVETGIQNTGLPILLLKFSLPQPDADLSVVAPVAIACLMPIPLWIAIGATFLYKKCRRGGADNTESAQRQEFLNSKDLDDGNHGKEISSKSLTDPTAV